MAGVRIRWKGDKVTEQAKIGLLKGLTKFGLRVEGNAKRRLQPSEQDSKGRWLPGGGHGVRTGTLRRSIHLADVDYNWPGDNVKPSPGTPERGGQTPSGGDWKRQSRVTISIGSGLEYAMPVHQGWRRGSASFAGYHFLTRAIEEERPNLERDLRAGVDAELKS